jgi:predicted RNase H-like HicB family nuclease
MSIRLSASIWQESDKFVSLCPELGVSSFGASPDEALRMLREAVELYLVNAKELGIIEELSETLQSPLRFQTTFEVEVA